MISASALVLLRFCFGIACFARAEGVKIAPPNGWVDPGERILTETSGPVARSACNFKSSPIAT